MNQKEDLLQQLIARLKQSTNQIEQGINKTDDDTDENAAAILALTNEMGQLFYLLESKIVNENNVDAFDLVRYNDILYNWPATHGTAPPATTRVVDVNLIWSMRKELNDILNSLAILDADGDSADWKQNLNDILGWIQTNTENLSKLGTATLTQNGFMSKEHVARLNETESDINDIKDLATIKPKALVSGIDLNHLIEGGGHYHEFSLPDMLGKNFPVESNVGSIDIIVFKGMVSLVIVQSQTDPVYPHLTELTSQKYHVKQNYCDENGFNYTRYGAVTILKADKDGVPVPHADGSYEMVAADDFTPWRKTIGTGDETLGVKVSPNDPSQKSERVFKDVGAIVISAYTTDRWLGLAWNGQWKKDGQARSMIPIENGGFSGVIHLTTSGNGRNYFIETKFKVNSNGKESASELKTDIPGGVVFTVGETVQDVDGVSLKVVGLRLRDPSRLPNDTYTVSYDGTLYGERTSEMGVIKSATSYDYADNGERMSYGPTTTYGKSAQTIYPMERVDGSRKFIDKEMDTGRELNSTYPFLVLATLLDPVLSGWTLPVVQGFKGQIHGFMENSTAGNSSLAVSIDIEYYVMNVDGSPIIYMPKCEVATSGEAGPDIHLNSWDPEWTERGKRFLVITFSTALPEQVRWRAIGTWVGDDEARVRPYGRDELDVNLPCSLPQTNRVIPNSSNVDFVYEINGGNGLNKRRKTIGNGARQIFFGTDSSHLMLESAGEMKLGLVGTANNGGGIKFDPTTNNGSFYRNNSGTESALFSFSSTSAVIDFKSTPTINGTGIAKEHEVYHFDAADLPDYTFYGMKKPKSGSITFVKTGKVVTYYGKFDHSNVPADNDCAIGIQGSLYPQLAPVDWSPTPYYISTQVCKSCIVTLGLDIITFRANYYNILSTGWSNRNENGTGFFTGSYITAS